MPENRTNYGTKKMVYQKRLKDTQVDNNDAPIDERLTDYKWNENSDYKMPFFVLCGPYSDVRDHRNLSIKSCYCPDCRRQFAFDEPIRDAHVDPWSVNMNSSGNAMYVSAREVKPVFDAEPTCPECGRSASSYVFIPSQEKTEENDAKNRDLGEHINYEGSWRIPSIFQGRYVFEYRDDAGNLTRMDDNVMLEHTVLFPSGKQYTWESEFSQTIDLVKNRIVSYETRIDGNSRTPKGPAQEVVNPFAYPDITGLFSMEHKINVQNMRACMSANVTQMSCVAIVSFKDGVFGRAFNASSVYRPIKEGRYSYDGNDVFAGVTHNAMRLMTNEISTIKSHAVMERFAKILPHPIYSDLINNGLNLTKHTKNATEENTTIDTDLRDIHTYMCVRYPAAVELAASKAELRAVNYEFAEKRKAQETPGYTPKAATDSARAKFFREEMRVTAEQLCACDDKILNEIRLAGNDSPCYVFKKDENGKASIQKVDHYVSPEAKDGKQDDVQIMKDRLSFFVYGLRDGYPVPGDIAVKLKNSKTMKEATCPTKKLKNSFNTDPIAMASNLYTLRKWGITNSDHVKQTIELVSSQSPEVNPPSIRIKGHRTEQTRKYKGFVNAGVIAPMRDRTALSFIKLYGATHDTSTMISQVFDNTDDSKHDANWRQLVEDIRLYGDIADNPAVSIIRTKADIIDTHDENSNNNHEQQKTQLRNYLDNSGKDGIRTAYRDFAGIYGKNTVEMINMLAREIKMDEKLDEIKRFAADEGMGEALSKYSDFLSQYENPEQTITDHQMFTDRTLVIATRNNKPLFERDLKEIHDELAEMGRKTVTKNEYLKLSDEILAMNESIEVDLSKVPKSQWTENPKEVPENTMGEFSFHVLDNRFDFVRTATNLRNCVAGGSYFNSVKSGRTLICSMENENNQTCACIELIKSSGDDDHKWYVNQLQGYRDGVVDVRYSEAFTQWCEAHDIDYNKDPSGNVKACLNAERLYFYGDGAADYHTEEYDPVLNTTITNSKAERLRKERINQAIALYGGDEMTGPNLPEVPDDLKY